jgi:tRNA/rRNA methyltransferase
MRRLSIAREFFHEPLRRSKRILFPNMSDMKVKLQNVSIVLHKPHFPENIGSAARAAKNMGIDQLVVVRPVDCDLTRILKMATHAAEDVVAEMEVHDDLRDALASYQYVVGTTARVGSHRQTLKSPRRVAHELVPITQSNRVALLFGPEDRGLTNSELRYCHTLVTIPTTGFASLNLAQAVMVLAYEIFSATLKETPQFVPRLASSHEMQGMYDHLSATLAKIQFMNPENPEYWMNSIRRFVNRLGLQAREVKIIRGICRQLDWYCSTHGLLASDSKLGPCPGDNISGGAKTS